MKDTLKCLFRKKTMVIILISLAALLILLIAATSTNIFGLIPQKQTIFVDSGEGAAEQFAKSEIPFNTVHTVIISDLNLDCTSGLYAILGMRLQEWGYTTGDLTVYGPPGTKKMVDGMVAALQPLDNLLNAGSMMKRSVEVKVIEVKNGSKFNVGPVKVSVTGSGEKSLSYQFTSSDRSLTYTGKPNVDSQVQKMTQNYALFFGKSNLANK